MGIPTVRLVFDRKHVATGERNGLVLMEFCYERKRIWIGMGIRLYSGQWDDRRLVVNLTEMAEYNALLRSRLSEMEKWLRDNFSDGGFEWSALVEAWEVRLLRRLRTRHDSIKERRRVQLRCCAPVW